MIKDIQPGDKVFLIRQPSITGVVKKVYHSKAKSRLMVDTGRGYEITRDADEWWIVEEKDD